MSQVEANIKKKEEFYEEKSKIYKEAKENQNLSPEQIKELKDLDFKVERMLVDTKFEYEKTFAKINVRGRKYFEEEKTDCTWGALCGSGKVRVEKEETIYDIQESERIIGETEVFKDQVHILLKSLKQNNNHHLFWFPQLVVPAMKLKVKK